MNRPAAFVFAASTFLFGIALGRVLHRQASEVRVDRASLAFSRTISLQTFPRGGGQVASLDVSADKNVPHRVEVERAAQRLFEMNKRKKLVGDTIDRLNSVVGEASMIHVMTELPHVSLSLQWECSFEKTDAYVNLEADMITGRITKLNFTASDGRWPE